MEAPNASARRIVHVQNVRRAHGPRLREEDRLSEHATSVEPREDDQAQTSCWQRPHSIRVEPGCKAGGKPSTWFPPGGLVERLPPTNYKRAHTEAKLQQLNLPHLILKTVQNNDRTKYDPENEHANRKTLTTTNRTTNTNLFNFHFNFAAKICRRPNKSKSRNNHDIIDTRLEISTTNETIDYRNAIAHCFMSSIDMYMKKYRYT